MENLKNGISTLLITKKIKFWVKKVNFINENEIKRKYKIVKVYGKSGLIYIFDTNGFHRQASVESENHLNFQRELITIYLNPKN